MSSNSVSQWLNKPRSQNTQSPQGAVGAHITESPRVNSWRVKSSVGCGAPDPVTPDVSDAPALRVFGVCGRRQIGPAPGPAATTVPDASWPIGPGTGSLAWPRRYVFKSVPHVKAV